MTTGDGGVITPKQKTNFMICEYSITGRSSYGGQKGKLGYDLQNLPSTEERSTRVGDEITIIQLIHDLHWNIVFTSDDTFGDVMAYL